MLDRRRELCFRYILPVARERKQDDSYGLSLESEPALEIRAMEQVARIEELMQTRATRSVCRALRDS
jgi:hypothetical protein